MPIVRRIGIEKKGLVFRIKEKLSNGNWYVAPAIMKNKYPNDIVIDAENNLTTYGNLIKDFHNKTTGLNNTPSIAHGITKDSGNYPSKKNNVYEKLPRVSDFFKNH